jgi:tetratricopeptide (TPR) repeat protein
MKRKDKSDFYGINKSDLGEFEEAQVLLEKAIESDPNNVWLFLQLAKNSFKQNDFESFNRYLQRGREIYPQYEPFYLLEAQYLFDKKEFREAKVVLNGLTEINPCYGRAAQLVKAVNEKLKID